MTYLSRFTKTLFVLFCAALLLLLAAGCKPKAEETPLPIPETGQSEPEEEVQPPADPSADNTMIVLPDGTKIILRPQTLIEILEQPGLPEDAKEIVILIEEGEFMVLPNLEEGQWLTVQSPAGHIDRVQGCAMVVHFDGMLTYEMKCIGGICEFGPSQEDLVDAYANFTWRYQTGELLDPEAIDFEALLERYGEELPECVVDAESLPIPQTGGEEETPTPSLEPTASGTPEPSVTPDLDATATESCRLFEQEFPSTPCP